MKKIKVVVSQSGVTAGQLQDLFRMIGDGTVDGENLGGFLESPRKFRKSSESASVVRAIKILGERRVFTPERVAEVFNPLRKRTGLQPLVPPQGMSIPYSEEAVRKHADGRWLLVWSYGLSLREQRQMVGTDTNQQPCFYKEWDWFLKSAEDGWAGKGMNPGWYLVSLEGRFGNQTWQQQEESIQKEFGQDYERADEHLMGEACLSAYLINNGERPLKNFYHWGKSLGSHGDRVCVSRFDPGGRGVDGYPPAWGSSVLQVCLLRKFQ